MSCVSKKDWEDPLPPRILQARRVTDSVSKTLGGLLSEFNGPKIIIFAGQTR